ncbi:MAG: dihydroxyacetone kinase subunit DhaK [Candidatus Malihini olakiniferum]
MCFHTVLAKKLLGPAAEEEYSLDQCVVLATRITNQVRSIGVALPHASCLRRGKPSLSLLEDEIEFGINIHGKPDILREKYTDGDTIVSAMLDEILDNTPYVRTLRQWDREKGE